MPNKLTYKKITGIIRCETGLRIGGSDEIIEIGGIDNPIIKHPITNYPYIPGSSLKGKLRSLMEWDLGLVNENNGNVHQCTEQIKAKDCKICNIFGVSAGKVKLGPTRIIVRDAVLRGSEKCIYKNGDGSKDVKCHVPKREVWESQSTECNAKGACSLGLLEKLRREKGLMYSEEKIENTIDRLSAKATPRHMERVPAGIEFDFEILLRVFEDLDKEVETDKENSSGDTTTMDTHSNNNKDKSNEYFNLIKRAMCLLQNDTLGGSGSRGYGKINFLECKDESNNSVEICLENLDSSQAENKNEGNSNEQTKI